MADYQSFVDSLLPGNYALTKSMELTKLQTSGTLWYIKKSLVLYYYIFLSNEIGTRDYIKNVRAAFDGYIAALGESVQAEAKKFFYSDDPATDFRSSQFTVFSTFAGVKDFATRKEETEYIQKAKKHYFTLLMGSGGQNGVKKRLKEALGQPGFVYSAKTIESVLYQAALEVTAEECNRYKKVRDHSVKYILSAEAIAHAQAAASKGDTLDAGQVRALAQRYPRQRVDYDAVERDLPAFLRNERQALCYYGFFHSKSSGATEFEFSSLTPIGELALRANAVEFQVIWEQQKLKMISQPITVRIGDVPLTKNAPEGFAISFTPYLDILSHLARHKQLTLDAYKFVVARRKHTFPEEDWLQAEDEILRHTGEIGATIASFGRKGDIGATIASFGRKGDIGAEDSRKELLKYLLGIRADLKKDCDSNVLGLCRFQNNRLDCVGERTLELMLATYTKLSAYKLARYEPLFCSCEENLRRCYIATANHQKETIEPKIKINWDLYNIRPDKLMLLAIAMLYAAAAQGIHKKIAELTAKETRQVGRYLRKCCPNLLEGLGIRKNENSVAKEAAQVVSALATEEYSRYMTPAEDRAPVLAAYRGASAEDLLRKLQAESAAGCTGFGAARTRNKRLTSDLKTYYIARFQREGTLQCECCGAKTFIAYTGEPYLEFHHLIPFGIAYGPDHYLNLFALCPDCHRKLHFLHAAEKGALYKSLDAKNYLHLKFVERLETLKEQSLLRSYHLEYLLADNAITQEEYDRVAA